MGVAAIGLYLNLAHTSVLLAPAEPYVRATSSKPRLRPHINFKVIIMPSSHSIIVVLYCVVHHRKHLLIRLLPWT